jgi:NADPH-dependent 2,4-dienoyl-CoA reductase/sulfur reductase-like enzyme
MRRIYSCKLPASLHARFRLDVRVSTEVLAINPSKKTVALKNLISGETSEMDYRQVNS